MVLVGREDLDYFLLIEFIILLLNDLAGTESGVEGVEKPLGGEGVKCERGIANGMPSVANGGGENGAMSSGLFRG